MLRKPPTRLEMNLRDEDLMKEHAKMIERKYGPQASQTTLKSPTVEDRIGVKRKQPAKK